MSDAKGQFQKQVAFQNLQDDYGQGNRFIVWAGAGLSRLMNLPLWADLRSALERELIDYAQKEFDLLKRQRAVAIATSVTRVPDAWDAFKILKGRLPRANYEGLIRKQLATHEFATIVEPICGLWRLRDVKGVVTLNLDDLLSRAFSQVFHGGSALGAAVGTRLSHYGRMLNDPGKFLVNLHGILSESDSWIFTRDKRDELFSSPHYNHFVQAAFGGYKCLFVGMKMSDPAIAVHFEYFARHGIDLTDHYWLTAAEDIASDVRRWAGDLGIRIIDYDATNIGHEASITAFWKMLDDYLPSESEALPINPGLEAPGKWMTSREVQSLDPEQARNVLSSYASEILNQSNSGSDRAEIGKQYDKFFIDYHTAIQVAGAYLLLDGRNTFFGYTLEKEIGGGAFGRVYKATKPSQQKQLAIKITKPEVRNDKSRLNWFRRGVHAMQILDKSSVAGMVKFENAFEIPPSVVMEYIDGPNLEQMVETRKFDLIRHGLPVLTEVAEIIEKAHTLPERVLHRDIRPSNIMVRTRDWLSEIRRTDVVVLDFDLAWYTGAEYDGAISQEMITVLGYLAPEQIHENRAAGITAKHALVDSFGLGMTLLYVVRGRHPEPNERKGTEWAREIQGIARRFGEVSPWRCFGNRLAQLIEHATQLDQTDRMNFYDLMTALQILNEWIPQQPHSIEPERLLDAPPALVLEELFCRSIEGFQYKHDENTKTFSAASAAGGSTFSLSERQKPDGLRMIEFRAFKANDGTANYQSIKKYWTERFEEVAGKMRKVGWKAVTMGRGNFAGAELKFECDYESLCRQYGHVMKGTAEAMRRLISLEIR